MSMSLTDVFGLYIKVYPKTRDTYRQFSTFAGGDGVVSMFMGSGGYPVIVSGTLRTYSGLTYSAARAAIINIIDEIDKIKWAPPQTYTYRNETYYNCILETFTLLESNGTAFHYVSGGACIARFTAVLRAVL